MAPILRSVIFNGSPAASLADLTYDEVRSFTKSQQKAVVKWRNDFKNGREVDNDAIKKLLGQESSGRNESKKKSRNQKKRKKKVRANKLKRGTDAQISKTTSEDVRLLIMSDDSDSDVDDDSLESKPVDELKKVAVYKKVRKVCSTANGTPIDELKYQTVLDTGTEWTVVGRPGWIVTQIMKRSLSMSAVDEHVRMKPL